MTHTAPAEQTLAGLSVCVVACHFEPETSGSAPYNTFLVDSLVAAGARVDVVAGVPHYPGWTVQDPRYRRGLRWIEHPVDRPAVRVIRVRHAVPGNPNLFGRGRLESSFALLSAPAVASSKADVIVAVTPLLGAVLGAMTGKRGRPTAVIVHDLVGNAAQQAGVAGGRAANTISRLEYSLLRKADQIGVITSRFTSPLVRNGVDQSAIVEVPIFSHVERSQLSRSAARRKLGWSDTSGFTVVHTGNIGMKQGLEHLLEAARYAGEIGAPFDFVLVGDGNMRRQLEAAAENLPNVRFVDPVSEAEYPLVLAAADMLLVHERPGVREMSLPSKITSYVTAARPLIAAVENDGIAGSLLTSYGAALTVRPGDAGALVDGLSRIANDPALRDRLAAGARALGAAEFAEDRGRAAFVGFVADLADTGQVGVS